MKCILHIGTEKTATTTLQHWLYQNETALSNHRVALTRTAGFPNNRHLSGYFQTGIDDFIRSLGAHTMEEKAAVFAPSLASLADEVAQKSAAHDTLILTSEHFHSRVNSSQSIGLLKDFLFRTFDDVQVICYFREQSEVRRSLFSTTLKYGQDNTLATFQNDISEDDIYYNYARFLQLWEEAFGRHRITPRLFGEEHFAGGDIRLDFMAAMLPHIDTRVLDLSGDRQNSSVSSSTAAYYKVINHQTAKFAGPYLNTLPEALRHLVGKAAYLADDSAIQDPRAPDFYDLFHQSNLDFFECYFGVRENLFLRPPDQVVETKSDVSNDAAYQLLQDILEIPNLLTITNDDLNTLTALVARHATDGGLTTAELTALSRVISMARPKP